MSLLLCEGGVNSPDVRVLSKLLGGRCQLRPHGPRYGMGASIIARRDSIGRNEVFGILDGDFVESWQAPIDRPVEWRSSDGTVFGWRWERKEIENYLIDPTVVESRPESVELRGVDPKLSDVARRGSRPLARLPGRSSGSGGFADKIPRPPVRFRQGARERTAPFSGRP